MKVLLRVLSKALLVGLIAAGAYVGVLFVMCKVKVGENALIYRAGDVYNLKGGNTYRKFREFDPAKHYDVVVIGSSHAYRGYDPRIFREQGLDMFNLGTSSQTPLNTHALLKEFITEANTGLIVLDCYENALALDGLESAADLSQNVTSDAAVLRMVASMHDPRVFNMFTVRMLMRNEPAAYVDSFYVEAGYSMNTDSAHDAIDYGLDRTLELGARQPEYLVKCIRYCQEQGIPIVLVTHPLPQASNHPRHEAFHDIVDSVAQATGVEYIDYAFKHGLPLHDRHHYYDHNHFNQAGVALFNPKLIEDLRGKGYVKD
ncbi:MAG: hypothetical protein IPJ76_14290 [Flavobacteriales bacterium]|nr:MAG: hypothetical protein IPJ76_14290 [Flavobacteriales bacterium]